MKLVAVALILLQTAGASPLIGRWDAATRSRGGLGTWMELAGNGTCSQTTGAMVDGTWILDGNRLTVTIIDDQGAPHSQSGTIQITGNILTQTAGDQSHRLERQDPVTPSVPALVGVWRYPHPAGGDAYDQYASDGRFLLRLPMTTATCRWTSTGTQLRLTFGNELRELRWSIAGDQLIVDGDGGRQMYHRERALIPPAKNR